MANEDPPLLVLLDNDGLRRSSPPHSYYVRLVIIIMAPNTTEYSNMNLALVDPAHWGWSAGGQVVNLMTPQEVSNGAVWLVVPPDASFH